MAEWTSDIVRESRQACARLIREDFMEDEEMVRKIRARVEETRCYAEAYGTPMTTHDWVTLSLGALADVLRDGDAPAKPSPL